MNKKQKQIIDDVLNENLKLKMENDELSAEVKRLNIYIVPAIALINITLGYIIGTYIC
jgi:hypothetical protein